MGPDLGDGVRAETTEISNGIERKRTEPRGARMSPASKLQFYTTSPLSYIRTPSEETTRRPLLLARFTAAQTRTADVPATKRP